MKIERFAIGHIDVEIEPSSNTLLSRFMLRVMVALTWWRFIRFVKIISTIRNEKTGEETQIGKPMYRLFVARVKFLSAS